MESLPYAFILINFIEEAVSLLSQLNSVVPFIVFSVFPVFLISKFLSNSFLGSWSIFRVSTVLWICKYFAYVWVPSHHHLQSVQGFAQLCKRHWGVTWFTFWPTYIWSSLQSFCKIYKYLSFRSKDYGQPCHNTIFFLQYRILTSPLHWIQCLPLITWELLDVYRTNHVSFQVLQLAYWKLEVEHGFFTDYYWIPTNT